MISQKETVSTITMLYIGTKDVVCSLDGDINFFDIVAEVLLGNTQALYISTISLDYIQQMSVDLIKVNDFILKRQVDNIS